jgi:hypothetical protein
MLQSDLQGRLASPSLFVMDKIYQHVEVGILRDKLHNSALEQKGRSERLYLHYALALAVLLFLAGIVLTILGVGAHLDIIVSSGKLEGRLVNATPGVALVVVGAAMFLFSRPRPLKSSSKITSKVHDYAPPDTFDENTPEGPLPQTTLHQVTPRPTRVFEQSDTIDYARMPPERFAAQDTPKPPRRKRKQESEGIVELPSPPSIKTMQIDLQAMRVRREVIKKSGDEDALWMIDRDIGDLEQKLDAAIAKKAAINATYRDE